MKNNKLKLSLKVVLASTIAATSAAAIVYATPGIIKTVAGTNENKFVLDVENIDEDTLKVSIDNIEDIPKALQFSIKLDGIVPKKLEDGNLVIKDLIKTDDSNEIITDYTYNESDNTIDVLITSESSIPKNGNEVEVFELDIENTSNNTTRKYTVLPNENSEYKYVSNTNKEYVKEVEVANEELLINTAPTIVKKENNYIEINVGEKLSLTKEELSKYIEAKDAEEDEITFEVKDIDDKVIEEFTSTIAGIYDLYVTAIDSFGAKSEIINVQVKVNEIEKNPTITRNDKELEDITINAGQVFNLMDGIKAVDAIGTSLDVKVKSDKELNLDPDVDTKYQITYTAIDGKNRTTKVEITLTVKANKAPIIIGVTDHTLAVGDEFNPEDGVKVIDEDDNIELVIESNVNTKVAGVYKVIYKATDSGNKTTIVKSIVVVNPKMEQINRVPVINANDVVIQLGEDFNPLNGVTATDVEDGPISKIDVVRNEVNNNVAGKYEVTYSATDSKGASTTKTITVIVNDPPKINAEDKTIKLGQKFDPLSGVSASDKEDGNITDIYVIENNVDENNEGKYTVTYSVEDSLGGKATKTITITVERDIVLADSITINNKVNSLYVGSSKILTASVNETAELKDIEWTTSDENIASIEIIGNDVKVIAKKEGKVIITAKTKDGSNKFDSITIDILNYKDNVADFIKDIIDTSVVAPVLGNGDIDSPLEMEVQNISVEKFDEFLSKIKKLNPILVDTLKDKDFTLYKIKVENTSGLSKFIRLFKGSISDEGYINIKIANNLDNESLLKAKLEDILTYEDNSGNAGGNNSGNAGGNNSGNAEGNNSGNAEGNNSGNAEGNNSGNAGGNNSGNAGGNNSGNTGGDNSGNAGGNNSGNAGGNNSGNTEGDNSGNAGGNNSGNTGGNNLGNAGGNNSGNTEGDNSGNTEGDNSGNAGGNNSGNTEGDNSGNAGGNNSGNTEGDNSGNTGGNNSGDINNENNNEGIKLPITGKESIIGYVGLAIIAAGTLLVRKRKK